MHNEFRVSLRDKIGFRVIIVQEFEEKETKGIQRSNLKKSKSKGHKILYFDSGYNGENKKVDQPPTSQQKKKLLVKFISIKDGRENDLSKTNLTKSSPMKGRSTLGQSSLLKNASES